MSERSTNATSNKTGNGMGSHSPNGVPKREAPSAKDTVREREQRFNELLDRLDRQTGMIERQTAEIEHLKRENAALREQVNAGMCEQAERINAQTQATNIHTAAIEVQTKAFGEHQAAVTVLRQTVEECNKLIETLNSEKPPNWEPTFDKMAGAYKQIADGVRSLEQHTRCIAALPHNAMNGTADRVMGKVEKLTDATERQTRSQAELEHKRRAGRRWWLGLPLKAVAAASLFWGCVVSFPKVLPEPVQLQFATHIVGEDAWVSGNRLMEVGDPYTYGVVKDMVEFVKSPQSDLRRCEAEARAMRRDVECQFPLLVPAPDVPARAQATRNRSPFFNRRTTFRHL